MTFLVAANISCGMCFVKMASKTLLQSVDAVCGKVEFCAEYGTGVYDCTRLLRRRSKAKRLHTMRRRTFDFYKKIR